MFVAGDYIILKGMEIRTEKRIRDFRFWSGAVSRASMLTNEELDQVEEALTELYGSIGETELNDLFWFEFGFICGLLGYIYNEEEDRILRQ